MKKSTTITDAHREKSALRAAIYGTLRSPGKNGQQKNTVAATNNKTLKGSARKTREKFFINHLYKWD